MATHLIDFVSVHIITLNQKRQEQLMNDVCVSAWDF